jgi:hypothetical protein
MFNTLNYARKLETAGVPREQAEAHIQIIADIIEGDLATKRDLKDLENRLILKLSAIMATMISLATGISVAFAKIL